MERAIGYVRVSTQEQASEGVSLEAQAARIRAYCEAAGLELVTIIEEPGISGSKPLGTRPGGLELVRTLAKGEATHIIAVKLDRLFRDAVDALGQTRAWDKAGVALHLIDLGGTAINTASPVGRLFITMLSGVAELERSLIGERTAQILAHKKAAGEVYGSTPFGFDRVGDRLIENPAELRTVDAIRSLAESGESLRAIARTLNAEGVRTKRGGRWHARTVAYMLRNDLHSNLERVAA